MIAGDTVEASYCPFSLPGATSRYSITSLTFTHIIPSLNPEQSTWSYIRFVPSTPLLLFSIRQIDTCALLGDIRNRESGVRTMGLYTPPPKNTYKSRSSSNSHFLSNLTVSKFLNRTILMNINQIRIQRNLAHNNTKIQIIFNTV
jgi:hypothetical protein